MGDRRPRFARPPSPEGEGWKATRSNCRRHRRRGSGWKRFLPALWMLLCMAGVVGEEFARQKGSSEFLASFGYLMMAAILVCMGWIYYRNTKDALPAG